MRGGRPRLDGQGGGPGVALLHGRGRGPVEDDVPHDGMDEVRCHGRGGHCHTGVDHGCEVGVRPAVVLAHGGQQVGAGTDDRQVDGGRTGGGRQAVDHAPPGLVECRGDRKVGGQGCTAGSLVRREQMRHLAQRQRVAVQLLGQPVDDCRRRPGPEFVAAGSRRRRPSREGPGSGAATSPGPVGSGTAVRLATTTSDGRVGELGGQPDEIGQLCGIGILSVVEENDRRRRIDVEARAQAGRPRSSTLAVVTTAPRRLARAANAVSSVVVPIPGHRRREPARCPP